MSILILSTSTNEHANAVQQNLMQSARETLRLDMDKLGDGAYRLCFKNDNDAKLLIGERAIRTSSISSVFVHHPDISSPNNLGVDELDRQIFRSNWKNSLDWFERLLARSIWINSIERSRRSASTARQLSVATALGLRTPNTYFTNIIDDVRNLASTCKQVIIKSGPLLGMSLQGQRLLAHVIDPASINPSELRTSPCLFQEYIEKSYELRVHVIGDKVLSCKIESQESEATRIDWRNYAIAKTPHVATEIDDDLKARCRGVVERLGLRFGILDLIVTPSGEPVFLECNSQGHWLWIEHLTGLRITEALCDGLVSGKKC